MIGLKGFRRVKKRVFVVAAIALVTIILVAGLLSWYAASLPGPADVTRLVISERVSRQTVLGSGIALSDLPVANWIRDPSFEPLVFRSALTVYQGNDRTLNVSAVDAAFGAFGEDFLTGAQVRIKGWTESGLYHKLTAHVASFGMNRVGQFQRLDLPGGWPEQNVVHAFIHWQDQVLAVGDNGLIIYQVAGNDPILVDLGTNSRLTSISASEFGLVIGSEEGEIWFSQLGIDWQLAASHPDMKIRSVALDEQGLYVAAGDDGKVMTGQIYQPGMTVRKLTTADLNAVVYGADRFLLAGDEGSLYTSQGGLIWRRISKDEATDWRVARFHDSSFFIVGSGSHILTSRDGSHFETIETDLDTGFLDLVLLSRQQLIALDAEGEFVISNDSGRTWLGSALDTGMKSQVIALADKDKIISAGPDGQLGLAQLVDQIELDSSLKEGQFQSGDRVFLEKISHDLPDLNSQEQSNQRSMSYPWQFYGPGLVEKTDQDQAPAGGRSCLLIERTGITDGQPTIISQVLDPAFALQADRNEIYQIAVWLKQEPVSSGDVQIWLDGPFEPVGTTLGQVGASWRQYTFTFVMPAYRSVRDLPVRFNMSYSGEGILLADRVFFGRASEPENLTVTAADALVTAVRPQSIRMEFPGLGSRYTLSDAWTLPLGNESIAWPLEENSSRVQSLHTALQLAYNSQADPWLVVDIFASQADVLHLIEYLAGPISEPYGRLRQQNGSILPWTERFNRIYLEFNDSDHIFEQDRLRADWVNLLIDAVTRSPYYQQIKQKLVFIDGFHYQDGVMLSKADYHAADLVSRPAPDPSAQLEQAYYAYYSQIPRLPDRPGQMLSQMIRSAQWLTDLEQETTLAVLIDFVLTDLGEQTALANLFLDLDELNQPGLKAYTTAARICAQAAWGSVLDIEPFALAGDQSEAPIAAEPVQPDVRQVKAYGYISQDAISLVLINLSAERQDCLLVTDLPFQGSQMSKYDADGSKLNQQVLRHRNQTITLLPGGVVYIHKALTPDE